MMYVNTLKKQLQLKQQYERRLENQRIIMKQSKSQQERTGARTEALLLREQIRDVDKSIETLISQRHEPEQRIVSEPVADIVPDKQAIRLAKQMNSERRKRVLQKIDRVYGSLSKCPEDSPLLAEYRELIGVVIKKK